MPIKSEKSEEVKDALDALSENIRKNKDTPWMKAKIKELRKGVEDYKNRHNNARKYGKQIADRINKKYKSVPFTYEGKIRNDKGLNTDEASVVISEILYQCYKKQQESGEGCRELLNRWIHERMWGRIVMEYIPKLKEIWQYLHDNKHTKKNTLGFGDDDGAIWVEYPKQLKSWPDNRKIIIHKSYCTCADDDTHIFILDDSKIAAMYNWLHVRTVWPKEKRCKGYNFKDDRDIDVPSILTYRKRNFEFSYQDGRDKGYTLTLQNSGTPSVEWANDYQGRIEHALWLINHMEDITTNESYQCK